MCKFDKNSVYKPRDVAERLLEEFPQKKSAVQAVSSYFTRKGFVPVNGQKQCRVFSGNDCQAVYDAFKAMWAPKQLSMKEVTKGSSKDASKYDRVSIELRCKSGTELEERSRKLKVTKASIVDKALTEYFERHPFIDYDAMSKEELFDYLNKEDLINLIKMKEEQTNE